MHTSLSQDALGDYVAKQMQTFFPDGPLDHNTVQSAVGAALEKIEHCFSHIEIAAYHDRGVSVFDHAHTDHYATFLCFLARIFFLEKADLRLATKAYALNKALHGLDAFYEVDLPDIIYLQHPVGTVLGRATYGNYLAVYQGVTVGSSVDGNYPKLGEGVVLYGGARVIGSAEISSNSWVAPGTIVMDQKFPCASILFGTPPCTERRQTDRDVIGHFFSRAGE